jgi:hypothetical protein
MSSVCTTKLIIMAIDTLALAGCLSDPNNLNKIANTQVDTAA